VRAAILALIAGCQVTGHYHCTSDDQCLRGSETGFCELAGYCSFTDPSCASQRRYDDSAEAPYADQCVAAGSGSGSIVTGSYRQVYATNDSSFMPTVVDQAIAPANLTVTLADGSRPAVTVAADGTFSFTRASDTQVYMIDTSIEYQSDAAHVEIGDVGLGRPGRTPVAPATQVSIQFTTPPQGTNSLASTGLWATLDTSSSNNPFVVDWSTASTLSGPLALLDAAEDDRLYMLQYKTTNNVETIGAFSANAVTMTNGATTTLTNIALTSTPPDSCRHLVAPLGAAETRLAAAAPKGSPFWQWTIIAAAAPDRVPVLSGIVLAGTAQITPASDVDIQGSFANPFAGSQPFAIAAVGRVYNLAMNGVPGPSVATAFYSTSPFSAGTMCSEQTATLANAIELPGEISIGGTAVTADDQKITLDVTSPLQVTWAIAAPGVAGTYGVQLFELTNDGMKTTLTGLRTYRTPHRSLVIAPGMLARGHTYVFAVASTTGYPMEASGDFLTLSPAFEDGVEISHSFLVE